MAGVILRTASSRHGRACRGHPRLSPPTVPRHHVDARDKPAHDGKGKRAFLGSSIVMAGLRPGHPRHCPGHTAERRRRGCGIGA